MSDWKEMEWFDTWLKLARKQDSNQTAGGFAS